MEIITKQRLDNLELKKKIVQLQKELDEAGGNLSQKLKIEKMKFAKVQAAHEVTAKEQCDAVTL